jgi:cyanophycinase-like exopeptidase
LAIQGDFTYNGCTGSVLSSEALANPYHRYVTFTYDFFHWANLQSTITDSHFVTRDRMGRTLAFLARQIKDGKATSALAIAVNEATSVEVNRNGLATVVGNGPAYFILADHMPETCVAGTPLTYSGYKIWKVNAGGTFNLANRPATGYYLRSVNNGVIDQNPY